MASPMAASASTQPISTAAVRLAVSTPGHWPNSAMVKPRARATRATSGPLLTPGIGTNTRAPATRASTRRKPQRVPVENVSSVGIAAEISEQVHCVGYGPLQHPREQQEQPGEK